MKQPLRIELCKLLQDGKPRTQSQLYEELSSAYAGERQLLALEDHLQSLRCVGIIGVDSEWVEDCAGGDKLIQSWALTPDGKRRLAKVL